MDNQTGIISGVCIIAIILAIVFGVLYGIEINKPETTCAPPIECPVCETCPVCVTCDKYLGVKINSNNEQINTIIEKTNKLLEYTYNNTCTYINKNNIRELLNGYIDNMPDDEISRISCNTEFEKIKADLNRKSANMNNIEENVKIEFINNVIDLFTYIYPSVCENDKISKTKMKQLMNDVINTLCPAIVPM